MWNPQCRQSLEPASTDSAFRDSETHLAESVACMVKTATYWVLLRHEYTRIVTHGTANGLRRLERDWEDNAYNGEYDGI